MIRDPGSIIAPYVIINTYDRILIEQTIDVRKIDPASVFPFYFSVCLIRIYQ